MLKNQSMKTMLTAAITTLGLCACVVLPTQAASKNITNISPNKTVSLQLDGKGAKEEVRYSVSTKTVDSADGKTTDTVKSVNLTINGKSIFEKSYKNESELGPKVKLVVTDINKKDKQKDLFFGTTKGTGGSDAGVWEELIHITYDQGKVTKDPLLKTLKDIKSPAGKKYKWDLSGRKHLLNPIESYEHSHFTNGGLKVDGKGTVQWGVCLTTGGENPQWMHGYISLKLKSGKLTAANYPAGKLINTNGKLRKNLALYKKAGKSTKAATIAKGKKVKITEFKFVNKKVYFKVKYSKKQGWISESELKKISKINSYKCYH